MASAPPIDETIRVSRGAPDALVGAMAGGLTVLGFAVIHALWITDIWFFIVRYRQILWMGHG